VRLAAVFALALFSVSAMSETAYVSDELVLGVYSEENGQGQKLTTLHSGASLETLSVSGEFTQVRLSDGTTGWVKSSYLTNKEPAVVRVKQLEEELARSHATTPELAEAAAHNELEQLKSELADKQADLDALRATLSDKSAPPSTTEKMATAPWFYAIAASCVFALALGFYLGYATLARRVRQKFGGIKVY
jgi:uncharacterized protein YgiM (DUF1202 family)